MGESSERIFLYRFQGNWRAKTLQTFFSFFFFHHSLFFRKFFRKRNFYFIFFGGSYLAAWKQSPAFEPCLRSIYIYIFNCLNYFVISLSFWNVNRKSWLFAPFCRYCLLKIFRNTSLMISVVGNIENSFTCFFFLWLLWNVYSLRW